MNGNINDSDDGSVIANTSNQNRHASYTDGEPLSTAVVKALAEVAGDDPASMGVPLYDAIDPDALDNLFTDRHDGTPRMGGTVVFTILDYEVTVESYGEIVVREQS
ncbi:HalOD1 output domain-containing protein [Haladaptatus sp. NG-WS-4]